jgi:uncharacterized protein (TIGR03084 family)
MDVIADLEAEQAQLSDLLGSLTAADWDAPSLCPGWTIKDVVLHLAQTEEAVAATLEGRDAPIPLIEASSVDEVMENWVRTERDVPYEYVRERWEAARRSAVARLRAADPDERVSWAAAPLRPVVLATTRLAEHWVHALDIADPLGAAYPDTDRLHHVAWLAHRTLPYAFARSGLGEPPNLRAELLSPAGEMWTFGPEDAGCRVTGASGEFCRVAARRLAPDGAATLEATGDRAQEVLELIRTYA